MFIFTPPPFLRSKKEFDEFVVGLVSVWLETSLNYEEFLELPIPVVLCIGDKFKHDKKEMDKETKSKGNVSLPHIKR